MPRLRLTVAYVGTHFSGWQVQDKPRPPQTIQGELERVASHVLGRQVRIHGSGRTDAGVHADAQVAHMDVPETESGKAPINWQRMFNTTLPPDIRVMKVEEAAPGFHAQFDAIGKVYTYQLWLRRFATPPRLHPFVWACGPLNLEAMEAALPLLTGTRDFAALKNAGTDIRTTTRTVRSLYFAPEERISTDPLNVALRVEANGFLKQMVRNMVGLLVAIGRDKLSQAEALSILESGNRRLAPQTAPAKGLTLREVHYLGEGIEGLCPSNSPEGV